jgi:hypothetical protein
MPYLGIYRSWLTLCMVLTGVALMVLGFLLRGETIAEEHRNNGQGQLPPRGRRSRTYEENTAKIEQDYSDPQHQVGSLN